MMTVRELKAKLDEYQIELDRACLYYGAESKEAQSWLSKVAHVRNTLATMTDETF